MSKPWFEVSLRPYSGRLFVARSRAGYELAHQTLFKEPDVLNCSQAGRFSGVCGRGGLWTYLIWAKSAPVTAHEVGHAILHTFERCGIDPRCGEGEPFCYMLSQILLDITINKRKKTRK